MIKMDNIHGGSWKKLQNWATGLFLKKTADSALNMNGHATQNISSDTVYAGFGSSRNVVHMPRISYTDFGLDGSDKQAFFKAYFKKMVELFPYRNYIHFSGVITIDQIYYIDGYVNSTQASNLDSEGVPLRTTFSLYSYMFDVPYYWYRGSSGDFEPMTISTFPYGNTTKDNRINAMGSNYIRYENGLQICWGEFSVNVPNTTSWDNATALNVNHTFPQKFISTPSCLAQNRDSFNYVIGAVRAGVGSISTIEVYRHNSVSEGTRTFVYIAIGKWK